MIPTPPGAGGPPPGAPPQPEPEPEEQPSKPDRPAAPQQFKQISVSETEHNRLKDRIYNDFLAARSDHDARISRFRRYYRMWRGLNQTRGIRQDGPDLQVPMLKWSVFGAWARMMQSLLGEDAEIIAKATAPSDEKDAQKAGAYMTWRLFEYMQAVIGLATWIFRGVLNGRAHAEIIYEQEYYWQRDDEEDIDFDLLEKAGLRAEKVRAGVYDHEVLAYDGPRLRPLWPSQIIVPAQDNVERIDDFDWVIRRDRITPQQLLDGELRGKYQGVRTNWTEIVTAAEQRQERDYWWDDERVDADEAEGVDHTNTLGNRESLEIWRWYGKWRLPKGRRDSRPDNLDWRQFNQSELMVSYLPKVGRIVGIQDRRDLYPRLRKRTPFVDLSLVKDGSYWGPGFGELLEDLQNETTINHSLFRSAGMLSVGPLIFYKPEAGWDPETLEYEARMMIPCEDPNSIKVISIPFNAEYIEAMSQALKAIAELVTGVTNQSLGQSSDRPNAPRTASGQAMLINEGNVRASLDTTMLREDMSSAIGYIWSLDREYADEQVFFRVTDEDSVSFDVNKGFGLMSAEEREHAFGFDVKFATSIWSREAKKQSLLQIYTISMQNPVVQTNPKALWTILNRVWEAFGEDNFRAVIPEPPNPEVSKMPKEEWALMLKGEVVHVSPLDDDMQHLIDHRRRLEEEINEEPDRRDKMLEALAVAHIREHEHQKRQKMLLQQLAGQAIQALQSGAPAAPGGAPGAGQGLTAFAPPGPPGGAPGIAPPPVSPMPNGSAPGPQGPIVPTDQGVLPH